MIAKWKRYWFYRNSPCQCNWNCMKKSMENIDSDDRVWRLNNDHCFSVYCAIWMDYSNRNNYEVCAVHFKAEKKNIMEKDGFSSCHERGTKKKLWVPMRNRTSIVRIYHLLDLSSFLFFIQNTTLSTQLILAVCRTRVIYELFNGPCSPSSLCGSVVEHRSAVSDSLCYVFF